MAVNLRNRRVKRGQALIEMIFVLPIIMVFLVWLMQGVEVVRASAEQQKYVRTNLFLRLNNAAKFSVDYLGPNPEGNLVPTPIRRNAMWVVYSNQEYSLKRLAGGLREFQVRQGAPVMVQSKLGICLRPECK